MYGSVYVVYVSGRSPGGGGSGDGLGHWVPGQLGLKIKERRGLVEETTVARVRWKSGPLFVTDEIGERGTLAFPALAVADCVLLGFLLFITIAAYRAWVSRSV